MKFVLLIFFTSSFSLVTGQDIQQDIDEQVWKHFIKTFNDHDTEGFMRLHSKDAVRAPRDGKKVWNWNEYYQEQKRGDDQGKNSGSQRQLELRFTERIANGNLAVDVGIYKTIVIDKRGSKQTYYGRFHVVLRKENGLWKILVDTDSSEGGTISEKDFLAASD